MSYYISKIVDTTFEKAIEKVSETLKTEGFGVISEIDIHEKLKEKLGVEYRRYKILGACNPSFAYEALQKEDKIGTMLPCNVIVQELDSRQVEVAAVDPVASMQAIRNEDLGSITSQVKLKLVKVIENL